MSENPNSTTITGDRGSVLPTINRALGNSGIPPAVRPDSRPPSASLVKDGTGTPSLDRDALTRALAGFGGSRVVANDGRIMGVVPGRDGRPILTLAATELAGKSVADAGRTPGGPALSPGKVDSFGAAVARVTSPPTPSREIGPSGL